MEAAEYTAQGSEDVYFPRRPHDELTGLHRGAHSLSDHPPGWFTGRWISYGQPMLEHAATGPSPLVHHPSPSVEPPIRRRNHARLAKS
ncbi:MAG: hypothetical protein LC749_18895, partial [Actinobacteria bacterium]|nr:hypothetical protein [Actinomycetota bacterium]